jgi:hypothetical protein
MHTLSLHDALPILFIRWNPDNFKVNDRIIKKYNIDKRLEILVEFINYCIKIKVEQGVIYKKLFYDEYEEGDISFKKINEKELL